MGKSAISALHGKTHHEYDMNQLIFDIETIAQPEDVIRAALPPFDPDKVALGNRSKPEVVSAYIEECRAKHGDDIVAKGALDPRYGTVAIAGLLGVTRDGEPGLIAQLTGDESDILKNLWSHLTGEIEMVHTFGWNVKAFDFRFCVVRSLILGVKIPRLIYNPRSRFPFSDRICDLMEVFQFGDWKAAYTSLDAALKMLGLPPCTGSGKEFSELWKTDKKSAMDYNAQDIERCRLIADRLGLIGERKTEATIHEMPAMPL